MLLNKQLVHEMYWVFDRKISIEFIFFVIFQRIKFPLNLFVPERKRRRRIEVFFKDRQYDIRKKVKVVDKYEFFHLFVSMK